MVIAFSSSKLNLIKEKIDAYIYVHLNNIIKENMDAYICYDKHTARLL